MKKIVLMCIILAIPHAHAMEMKEAAGSSPCSAISMLNPTDIETTKANCTSSQTVFNENTNQSTTTNNNNTPLSSTTTIPLSENQIFIRGFEEGREKARTCTVILCSFVWGAGMIIGSMIGSRRCSEN